MNSKDLAVLQPYCENDMRQLKRMSRSIFMRFNEPLSNADYDDFYSIANLVLWRAFNCYDPNTGVCFEGFLHSCLKKKFKSELTRRHRQRRVINLFAVSLDSVNEDEEECSLLDYIPSDFDTFDEVLKRQERGQFSDKVQQYTAKLSKRQVDILNMLMDNYQAKEIQQTLEISEKEYADNLHVMRSYENVKILF